RQTMRFSAGIGELMKEPQRILLETGPGQALSALARQHPVSDGLQRVLSSLPAGQSQQSDMAVMLHALGQLWLAGTAIDWKAFHADQRRRRIGLPTYPFERKRYWIEPARALPMVEPATAAPKSVQVEAPPA